jgi:hypothetical protein
MEWGRENKCTLCTLFPTSFLFFCHYLLFAIVFISKSKVYCFTGKNGRIQISITPGIKTIITEAVWRFLKV